MFRNLKKLRPHFELQYNHGILPQYCDILSAKLILNFFLFVVNTLFWLNDWYSVHTHLHKMCSLNWYKLIRQCHILESGRPFNYVLISNPTFRKCFTKIQKVLLNWNPSGDVEKRTSDISGLTQTLSSVLSWRTILWTKCDDLYFTILAIKYGKNWTIESDISVLYFTHVK